MWTPVRYIRSFFPKRKKAPSGAGPQIRSDFRTWAHVAQEGEFRFHQGDQWRPSGALMEETIRLFDHFGFSRSQYAGQTVIDLGAGSKLRTKYFLDAKIIAIEPLADRFIREIPWCDLKDSAEVHSTPAETLVDACVNRADLVISINVLDHCYDFARIMANVRSYVKPDGLVFVSFDKHDQCDAMHPLQLTEASCAQIFEQVGFLVERCTKGADGILKQDTYGHGPYCLNYWLRRRPS